MRFEAGGTRYNDCMVFGILIPVSIIAVLGFVIAAGVFMLQRVRSGQPLVLSFRTIAAAYFHLMAIATLLVLTVGLSTGIKAGLADAFGREFSYSRPVTMRAAVGPGGTARPPPPVPEEQQERQRKDIERQYQNDWIQGITLTLVGAVLWGLHLFGRRRVTPEEPETRQFFARAYSTVLLAIFGLVGVVALPMGMYELLRFFLVPLDESAPNQPPGASVAMAVVFVPIWIYYLNDILARSRRENIPSPSMGVG